MKIDVSRFVILCRRRGVPVVALALLGWWTPASASATTPTPDEAERFLRSAEARLLELWVAQARTSWIYATYLTEDTQVVAAGADEAALSATVELAGEAARFDGLDLAEDVRRRLDRLKLSLVLPAPTTEGATTELTRLAAELVETYATGRYCRTPDECWTLDEMRGKFSGSRDPAELLDLWRGARTISPPMRQDYRVSVELANRGARELGYADVGAMWRSKYDMTPEAFAAEVDRLWEQVRPLYEALHCHVRARLVERYGRDVVSSDGPIPAHLLGNLWAQSWTLIDDLVEPPGGVAGPDVAELVRAAGLDEVGMVRFGERFFTSLGFEPLPESFWSRSMFVKPRDREVVCFASAWDIDWKDDVRLKMCIQPDDFPTVHHELGHNYYQRAYKDQPPLFADSAHDGFHEAVGDTIGLSMTPAYLVAVGLLDEAPESTDPVPALLELALDRIAFLPFSLLVDQWRWKVFSGEIGSDAYNSGWWDLRRKYQGLAPPVERTEADFDPGVLYHVPGYVPYARYFLSTILQFQLQRALCDAAGFEGPLHECSIYGSKPAGRKLEALMKLGASRPWPEALEAIAGTRRMDATAILDYFAPLAAWLEEQNEGRTCGW